MWIKQKIMAPVGDPGQIHLDHSAGGFFLSRFLAEETTALACIRKSVHEIENMSSNSSGSRAKY